MQLARTHLKVEDLRFDGPPILLPSARAHTPRRPDNAHADGLVDLQVAPIGRAGKVQWCSKPLMARPRLLRLREDVKLPIVSDGDGAVILDCEATDGVMIRRTRRVCGDAGEADVHAKPLQLVGREAAVIIVEVDLDRPAEGIDARDGGDDDGFAWWVAKGESNALACVSRVVWVAPIADAGRRRRRRRLRRRGRRWWWR